MINTLKITSIAAACMAVVFLVLSGMFGLKKDAAKEKFLASPGAIETFKKNAGRNGNNGEAPLVQLSQALSLKWNPPKPIEPVSINTHLPVVTAKFKLIGTCYYAQDPNKSSALIDDPGKGWRWVAKNDKIDYLTVMEIQDGKIVYKDGGNTREILAERPQGAQLAGIVVRNANAVPVAAQVASTIPTPEAAVAPQEAPAPEPTPEELKKQAKESADAIKQMMAQMKDSNMSAEDAASMGQLGDFLKKVEADAAKYDQNTPGPNSLPADANKGKPADSNNPKTDTNGVKAAVDVKPVQPKTNSSLPATGRRVRRTGSR